MKEMKIEEKIEFWTKSLIEDHSDENIQRFMADSEYCTFSGKGMSCPICSHGCFKINVLWAIGSVDKELADQITYSEMSLMTNSRTLD